MSEKIDKCELANLLNDIRKNEEQMKNFVKVLEGSTPNKGKDTVEFCKNYTILVLIKFCQSLDDRELMLAACGLLRGEVFHAKNMEDRIKAYWHYSHSYNKHFKYIKAESAPRKAREVTNNIIEYLTEALIRAMDENHGKLGLIDEVPDKLELPAPKECKNCTEESHPINSEIEKINDTFSGEAEIETKPPDISHVRQDFSKDLPERGTGNGENAPQEPKDSDKQQFEKPEGEKKDNISTTGDGSHKTTVNEINTGHTPETQKTRKPIVDFIYSDSFHVLLQTTDKLFDILLKIASLILVILFIGFMSIILRYIKIFIPDIDSTNHPINETSSALSEQVDNTEDDISDISNEEVSKP